MKTIEDLLREVVVCSSLEQAARENLSAASEALVDALKDSGVERKEKDRVLIGNTLVTRRYSFSSDLLLEVLRLVDPLMPVDM
jgi:hypothetical protein